MDGFCYFCFMLLQYSFIIPVFNRPDEIQELLQSFETLEGDMSYEIVIVEDGSTVSSEEVVAKFSNKLNINYYFKENSGPGDSRNYGMLKAKGADLSNAKIAGKFDGYSEAWTKDSLTVTSFKQLLDWVYEDDQNILRTL